MADKPGIIRPMTAADVAGVHAVEQACFDDPWSRESFLTELENNCARYLVLDSQGDILGFGGMWLILDEAHINNVAVLPAYQGLGCGRRLMKALMRRAYRAAEITRMTLEVRVSNLHALALYQSLGFATAGRRPNYYADGEDAYIMWCENTLDALIDLGGES